MEKTTTNRQYNAIECDLDTYNIIKNLSHENKGDLLDLIYGFHLFNKRIDFNKYDKYLSLIYKWILYHKTRPTYIMDKKRRQEAGHVINNKNLRSNIFSKDGYKCKKCGSKNDLTIDHIIPVSKGGLDNLENLQTLCFQCNLKKGAKDD